MKKIIMLVILLASSVCCLLIVSYHQHPVSFQDTGSVPVLNIQYNSGTETILPWHAEAEDIWYYFLPSYLEDKEIWCGELKNGILIDGGVQESKKFTYQSGKVYLVQIGTCQFQMVIRNTSNVPAVFLRTESGTMDIIHEDKENREAGELICIDENRDYVVPLEKITGHGNVTWFSVDKRSYHIKLESPKGLFGLNKMKDFQLLSLWFDSDKIHSRLAFDIGGIFGEPYTPKGVWVDLYTNGEYRGLYLLTEAVKGQDVFNTKKEGTFLLEKELPDRLEGTTYFTTEHQHQFVVMRPKELSEEQFDTIAERIQAVENSIYSQHFEEEIDIDSFVSQFLIDEISMNYDAFTTSCYLYKTVDDEKIHAGPAWDYDGSFGAYQDISAWWGNYETGTVLSGREPTLQLDWYARLYETDVFQNSLRAKLEESAEELNTLFQDGIPMYAEWISSSAANDSIRWDSTNNPFRRADNYQTWENNVRYLQYFCLNRLRCLCARYGVNYETTLWKPTGEVHTVRFFVDGDMVYSMPVPDGESIKIEEIEQLKDYTESNWLVSFNTREYFYSEYLPILEDCTLLLDNG